MHLRRITARDLEEHLDDINHNTRVVKPRFKHYMKGCTVPKTKIAEELGMKYKQYMYKVNKDEWTAEEMEAVIKAVRRLTE